MTSSPGLPSRDDERAAWDAIVADLSQEIDIPGIIAREQGFIDNAFDERDIPDDESADEHGAEAFTPAEPPPIPHPADVVARFAWAAVIGGPLLLIVSNVLSLGQFISGLGVALGIGGFVTLIARRRDTSPDERWGEDHFGDGAIR